MDSPDMTQSKAAMASKYVRTPGDRDWRDKSQNNTLFSTALLHVSPGIAYWDGDKDLCFFAWRIRQRPQITCNTKLRSTSHNWIIHKFSMNHPLPFSSITYDAACHQCNGDAVDKDMSAMVTCEVIAGWSWGLIRASGSYGKSIRQGFLQVKNKV
jgi:hypothetical protein